MHGEPRDNPDHARDDSRADQPARWAMFCLDCDYPLDLLRSKVCPECGRAFDAKDASTYRLLPTTVLDDPVMLGRWPITEAVGLCIRLEHAGIPAMLHEERGGVIAYSEQPLGSVWVERKDEPSARDAAAQPMAAEEAETDRAPWTCATCGERIDGNFAMCWNCSAERE